MIRSLIYVLWLYGSMAAIGLACFPFALVNARAANAAARAWSRAALWGARVICGLRVEIRGREHVPEGAALIAAKHQAMLDTIMPFALLPDPAVVLKKELLVLPVFGWFSLRAGMIAIDREAGATALRKMLREARAHAGAGRQIVIFPEGTRQEVGAAPDYQPGVAALYRDLNLPCVPVALNTGLYWPAHGVRRKPGVAVIEFLAPIPPGLSRHDFMERLQEAIETESDRLAKAGAA
jgi:1-acyl-sn-glycerol-3-phosphate acyltransferase